MDRPTSGAGKGSVLVIVSAQAGYVEDPQQNEADLPHVVIPGLPGNGDTRVFEIAGDSMMPVLVHGDYVACTRVEARQYVRDGLLYVIVSRSQGVTVKYLRIKQSTVLCYPENTVDYQPFELAFDEVKEVWEVQIRITRHISAGRFEYFSIGESRISRLENLVEKMLDLPHFKPQ